MLLGYKKSPQTAIDKMEEWVGKLRRAKSKGADKQGTTSGKAVKQKEKEEKLEKLEKLEKPAIKSDSAPVP